jgi:hypothetical protein
VIAAAARSALVSAMAASVTIGPKLSRQMSSSSIARRSPSSISLVRPLLAISTLL